MQSSAEKTCGAIKIKCSIFWSREVSFLILSKSPNLMVTVIEQKQEVIIFHKIRYNDFNQILLIFILYMPNQNFHNSFFKTPYFSKTVLPIRSNLFTLMHERPSL